MVAEVGVCASLVVAIAVCAGVKTVSLDKEASSLRSVRSSDLLEEAHSEEHVLDIPRVCKRRVGMNAAGTR